MVNGKVDDLSWSQLRPRRTVSPYILEAISSHDLQSFLRLVAINPCVVFNEQSPVVRKIMSFRQWRAETSLPSLVTKRLVGVQRGVPQRSAKRSREGGPLIQREEETAVVGEVMEIEMDEDYEMDLDWGELQPRRKQRRSTRPSLSQERSNDSEDREGSSSCGVEIGEDHQAMIPELRDKLYWMRNPVIVESTVAFSCDMCGGEKRVEAYLSAVNAHLRRRDGFDLAPFALEVALEKLLIAKGNPEEGLRLTVEKVPRGAYFPGIKGAFLYEEQCKFVRTLAEREKNFLYISRYVLPHRGVSELVWMYYARHKQLWLQNGGYKNGLVLDNGGGMVKRVNISTDRAIAALRRLAATAGDGFPIDGRAQQVMMEVRRGQLAEQRRRR